MSAAGCGRRRCRCEGYGSTALGAGGAVVLSEELITPEAATAEFPDAFVGNLDRNSLFDSHGLGLAAIERLKNWIVSMPVENIQQRLLTHVSERNFCRGTARVGLAQANVYLLLR